MVSKYPRCEVHRQVRPYWDYTYDPLPFQQTTVLNASNGQTRCPGFDYDYNHYQCYPYGTGLDDCWKCPPKVCRHFRVLIIDPGLGPLSVLVLRRQAGGLLEVPLAPGILVSQRSAKE